MTVVATTGTRVLPGTILHSVSADGAPSGVTAGDGCCVRLSDAAEERLIVATRLGVVQWSDSAVAVLRAGKRAREPPGLALPSAAGQTIVFGPRPGDSVTARVVRLARSFAYAEIIAVNGVWCSNKSASVGLSGSFRGVVRVEDIRPFRPTKDTLAPPPPSAAFRPGDVIVAEVISQSDVRQYQLSTLPERCGVVEASAAVGQSRVRLSHIPGRRDAMMNPADGSVHYRWCPLIRLQ